MKKIAAAALGVLMLAIPFAGCRSDGGLITLDVYSQLANYSGEQIGFTATLLEDKFGVRLNIISDEDGTYAARMESGDLGDIVIWANSGTQYQEAVKQGMLLDWESEDFYDDEGGSILENYGQDILEYFPTALESNRQINNEMTGKNNIYGIGHGMSQGDGHEAFFYSWDIRWDLYAQLGYPEVKDLDDYYDLLVAMKEICPTDDNGNPTYAFSLWPDWDDAMVMYIKAFASAYYGYDELGMGLYDTENNVFHGALEENGPYLEILEFFNRLNQAELIDPNSMTQTYDQMISKVTNGGTFASIFNYAGYIAYNTPEHLSEGKMMATLVPEEASVIVYGSNVYGGDRIWSIGAKSQYPELAMQVINYFATPEGAMSMWHGLEGVHWNYAEDGGMEYTEFGQLCQDDKSTLQNGHTWTSPDTGKTYELSGSFTDGTLQINNILWSFDAVNPDPRANGERFNNEFWTSQQGDSEYSIVQDWVTYRQNESDEAYGEGVYTIRNRQDYLEYRPVYDESGNLLEDEKGYTVIPAVNYAMSSKGDLTTSWNAVISNIKNGSWQAIMASTTGQYQVYVRNMITSANGNGYADCIEWNINEGIRKFGSATENSLG